MKYLGIAMHIAKSGRLIIKCEDTTSPNTFILDKRGNKIAKIQEIFGPINSPYISAITTVSYTHLTLPTILLL